MFDDRSVVIESPVQDVNLSKAPQADVLIAGIPCTGASISGRSKCGLEFAESHLQSGALFFSFLQFVQAVNPGVVLIENVTSYSETASMVVIRSVLDSLGYTMQETVMAGNEYGALEDRRRLFTVAVSRSLSLGDTEPFLVHPHDTWLSRLFTAIEHARLKAIPESLIAGLSSTVAHEVLGQSVIYPALVALGAWMGQGLRKCAWPELQLCA